MKRFWAIVLVCVAMLPALSGYALYDELTDDEYEAYYEIVAYLYEHWDVPLDDLLDEIAYAYDMTADDLYAFIEFAVDADTEHVWYPVNGGTKYHASAECSKMIDPRPATKDLAWEMGFTPCGRCKPGM